MGVFFDHIQHLQVSRVFFLLLRSGSFPWLHFSRNIHHKTLDWSWFNCSVCCRIPSRFARGLVRYFVYIRTTN